LVVSHWQGNDIISQITVIKKDDKHRAIMEIKQRANNKNKVTISWRNITM
jgi:hypothetical protein